MELDLYIAVDDLMRAVGFYRSAFALEPVIVNEGFAAFQVGSGRFGLMHASRYAVPVVRGNSTVGTLKVEDIDGWHQRLVEIGAKVTDVIDRGPFRLLMFIDPDGNVVEVASRPPTL